MAASETGSLSFRLLAATFFVAACGRVPLDLPSGTAGSSGTISDVGGNGMGTAGSPGEGAAGANGVACGGHRCAGEQICCILDGSCIDRATASSTCPKPATATEASIPGARPCGSNADCATNEFCAPSLTCLGPGTCLDRGNCGTSTGPRLCGCDGVTYVNVQTGCRAGVTTLGSEAPCGTAIPGSGIINCGRDDQCPGGQTCCAIYGRCIDARRPELCAQPPAGTRQACLTNDDCPAGFEFCEGEGCTGPGGCVHASPLECTGVLSPVCGCDGKTYTNASCARAAGVRMLTPGTCTLQ